MVGNSVLFMLDHHDHRACISGNGLVYCFEDGPASAMKIPNGRSHRRIGGVGVGERCYGYVLKKGW